MLEAEVARCKPLYGRGCGLHTSKFMRQSGITNLVEESHPDNGHCFYYAVAAAILNSDEKDEKVDNFVNNIFGITSANGHLFPPMQVKKIASFEDKYNLGKSINVVYQDEDGEILPVYASRKIDLDPIVLMLFHAGGEDNTIEHDDVVTGPLLHYSLVRDPQRLFAERQTSQKANETSSVVRSRSMHICWNCFNAIESKGAYLKHIKFCHNNGEQTIKMPFKGDKLSFLNSKKACSKTFKSAYLLFFDFESLQIPAHKPCMCSETILKNTQLWEEEQAWFNKLSDPKKDDYLAELTMIEGEDAGEQDLLNMECDMKGIKRKTIKARKQVKLCPHRTKLLKEQPPFAYSLVLCDRNKNVLEKISYVGEDCADRFIENVLDLSEKYLPTLSPGEPMESMSKKTLDTLYSISECYLCEKFMRKGDRVLDHDHLTGKYLGTAHNICNLKRRENTTMTCFAHNFSSYDSHFLIRSLNKFPDRIRDIFSVPLNGQKFKCLILNNKITFLDSLSFVPDSLAKCVDMLKKSDCKFTMVNKEVANSDYEFQLLTRKGVYPYSFATSITNLKNATELPPIKDFYNDLDGEPCSKEDYQHAQTVWKTFKCQNMLEYTNLYCLLDVLLLAEVITDTRDNMWENFGLDLCQYFSLPHLSLDVMLKMTGAEIDLIDDQEMSDIFQKNIRGGHSYVNTRHSERFKEGSHKAKGDVSLMYLDA